MFKTKYHVLHETFMRVKSHSTKRKNDEGHRTEKVLQRIDNKRQVEGVVDKETRKAGSTQVTGTMRVSIERNTLAGNYYRL